ncbi:hypothetical protein [Spirosoma rhododendri]|uniref:hypothetical protein n=1 Tax=Spirosoma rhododendri TaxID=2728024 RepID=UPI001581631C|nr:hypothetical protein [Spirosoma rhododendri]
MDVTLKLWRQKSTSAPGKLVAYQLAGLDSDMSFLEMLGGFGSCSFTVACAIECPASVLLESSTRLNREYLGLYLARPERPRPIGSR